MSLQMLNLPLVWVQARKPICDLKTTLLRKPPWLRDNFWARMNLPLLILRSKSEKQS